MFNILYNPWMGVVDENGNEKLVGLRDYLINAHIYQQSAENKFIPILRRLQQRLAETFVMDIFGLDVETEIELLDAGRFDVKKVDEYIKKCEESGISFDLFDENRPFMQADKKTFEKVFRNKKSGSVAAINPKMGSGNNKVFFKNIEIEDYLKNTDTDDNRFSHYDSVYNKKCSAESAYVLTFAEYMNLLLIAHSVAGQGGAGYRSGLMCVGVPPVLYHLDSMKHQTLFHSILMNAAFDDQHNEEPGVPMWKWATYEYGKNYLNSTNASDIAVPKMTGMFFPVMYLYPDIESINTNDNTISRVYKFNVDFGDAGVISTAREQWIVNTEPSVSAKEIKTSTRTFKTGTRFTEANRSWLDIKTYADKFDGGAPKSLTASTAKHDLHDMDKKFGNPIMTAYYIAMEQAKYLTQGMYQCYLPECILDDQEKKNISAKFISAAENIAYSLMKDVKTVDKALNSSDPVNDNNKHEIQTVERVIVNRFMRYCEGMFKFELIPEIASIDDGVEEYITVLKALLQDYITKMARYSWQLIYQIPVPYGKSIEVEKVYEKIRKERRKRSEQRTKND